jgi:hypothetical protein
MADKGGSGRCIRKRDCEKKTGSGSCPVRYSGISGAAPSGQFVTVHSVIAVHTSSLPDTATTQHSLFSLPCQYLLAEHPSAVTQFDVPSTLQQYQQYEVVFSVAVMSVLSNTSTLYTVVPNCRCCSLSTQTHAVQASTHTNTHTRTHIQNMHPHIRTYTRESTHTEHAHTRTYTPTHIRAHTYNMHTHTLPRTYARTH